MLTTNKPTSLGSQKSITTAHYCIPLAVPPSLWKATPEELALKAARNRLCVKLGALARQSIN